MTHFVRGDPRQQVGQDIILGLLAQPAEEVVREVLGEHELDEPLDEVAINFRFRLRPPDVYELIVGDRGLVPDRVEVAAEGVEVLEPLVQLE